jgi:hypothetical protein
MFFAEDSDGVSPVGLQFFSMTAAAEEVAAPAGFLMIGPCMPDVAATEFECVCAPGFSGDTCQDDFDECASDPCQNNAACVESSYESAIAADAYLCQCPLGYEGDNCADDID